MCLLERVKMKKSILLGFAGMLFVSASAQAISISGQAGEDYTNIGVGGQSILDRSEPSGKSRKP